MTFPPDKQVPYTQDERKCYFGKAPTLAMINQAYGPKTAQVWLVFQLRDLSEFSGIREKITPVQIKECANLIAADYPYLKVSELMLFFRQFKEGKFGKQFYGSVDPMAVMSAIRTFLRQRGEAYYNHENNNENSYDKYFRIIERKKILIKQLLEEGKQSEDEVDEITTRTHEVLDK